MPPSQQPPQSELVLPIVAGFVAMLLGPLLWVGCYQWFGSPYIGAVAIGLLVGLAVKFTAKLADTRLAIAAIVMTVIAAVAGFVWIEQGFIAWKVGMKPGLAESVGRFFGDLNALIFTALGAWLAFTLARRPAGVPHAPE